MLASAMPSRDEIGRSQLKLSGAARAESSLLETTDDKPRAIMLAFMAKVRRRKTIVNAES